ncbi:MAG: hypothetical protein ABFD08_18895 [Syntrophomonas sp.]
MVEILNLLSIASFNSRQTATAMDYLKKSIVIGMEEGYIRSFVDELEPMAVLLGSFTVAGKKQQLYVDDLCRRISKTARLMLAGYKKTVANYSERVNSAGKESLAVAGRRLYQPPNRRTVKHILKYS